MLLVKQGRAPETYELLRRKALNRVEQERKQGKSAPDYLEGIEPPWNDERQEVLDLYDEMMVQDFEERIAGIEMASATNRARKQKVLEKQKVGLRVKGVVRHNLGETYGLRPLLFIPPDQTPSLYLKFKPKY